jgi:glycosyltransferase involved in cell wall biosynthesis
MASASNPLVSVHFINFNRLKFLKNCVNSFLECNQYENVELIICDNGSTEPGTHEWLDSLKHPWIKHILRRTESARVAAAKNECRALAKGEYLMDVQDDFQFIARGQWMRDLIEVTETEPQPFTVFFHCTVAKKLDSYVLEPASTASGLEYYFVKNAGYHDVHFMKRTHWERVGPFLERSWRRLELFGHIFSIPDGGDSALSLKSRIAGRLVKPFARFGWLGIEGYEAEYMMRAEKHGFGAGSRAMLKYPIAAPIVFRDFARVRSNRRLGYYPDCDNGPFYYEIYPYEEIKQKYAELSRPPRTDEVCHVVGIKNYDAGLGQKLHYT